MIYIGVDGGGSKTALAAYEDGNLIFRENRRKASDYLFAVEGDGDRLVRHSLFLFCGGGNGGE